MGDLELSRSIVPIYAILREVLSQFWCGAPWLGVSACGPFMHGAGRFPRRKSPPDRLAEYHPSEARECYQRTFAACGRLRQVVEAVGFGGFLNVFTRFFA